MGVDEPGGYLTDPPTGKLLAGIVYEKNSPMACPSTAASRTATTKSLWLPASARATTSIDVVPVMSTWGIVGSTPRPPDESGLAGMFVETPSGENEIAEGVANAPMANRSS